MGEGRVTEIYPRECRGSREYEALRGHHGDGAEQRRQREAAFRTLLPQRDATGDIQRDQQAEDGQIVEPGILAGRQTQDEEDDGEAGMAKQLCHGEQQEEGRDQRLEMRVARNRDRQPAEGEAQRGQSRDPRASAAPQAKTLHQQPEHGKRQQRVAETDKAGEELRH